MSCVISIKSLSAAKIQKGANESPSVIKGYEKGFCGERDLR